MLRAGSSELAVMQLEDPANGLGADVLEALRRTEYAGSLEDRWIESLPESAISQQLADARGFEAQLI